jgi:hypothetical protein
MYAKKQVMMQPLFYAQRNENAAPISEVREDIRRGETFSDLCRKYPDASSDTLMRRGRETIDSLNGNSMMADLNSPEYGVDKIVQASPEFRARVVDVLSNPQKRSFLPKPKVEALERRLKGV